MYLVVNLATVSSYTVNLPRDFLNYLLTDGYEFGLGSDILCLKLTSEFGTYYCAMMEFTDKPDIIDIPMTINTYLNVINDMYIDVIRVDPQIPKMVKIQGHKESFGTITDIKEQLQSLFLDVKILNKGSTFELISTNGTELFDIVSIQLANGTEVDWGVTVETDVVIDFSETIEAIQHKEEQEERIRLESMGFIGPGRQLGAGGISREEWLNRLERKS
jgi:hypothetical protein